MNVTEFTKTKISIVTTGTTQGRIQGIVNIYDFAKFQKHCMKLRKFRAVGKHVGASPLRSATDTYLEKVTFPVIVIESVFLLPLGRYLLPITTMCRQLSRKSSKKSFRQLHLRI